MDFLDLKIIEGLGIYGPRNIMEVSRRLGIPEATLRRRLRQMRPQVFLQSNVYHTNIGLKKTLVFSKAVLGQEDLLYRCIDAHDYLIYIGRCYGAYEGCVSIFAIPSAHCNDFENFLAYIGDNRIAESHKHYWSTCFQTVNLKCDWFNEDSETWQFFWEDWITEVLTQGTRLPFTLVDPAEYPQRADETDIFILKELERDATISFRALAQKMNASVPRIKYHFDGHVIGKRLLENFQVVYYPFDKTRSNTFFFVFELANLRDMAKLARSLLNKPFALSLGKVFGEPSLFAHLCLPTTEFRAFIDGLGRLARIGFLKGYSYVIQDLEATQRYTIPYKSFRDKSWIYDQEKYLGKVDTLVDESKGSTVEEKQQYASMKTTAI